MHPLARAGLLAAVLLGPMAASTAAQGLQTGVIQGTVTDSQGAVLPGTTVTVASPALQGLRSATTDTNGLYIIRALPPGAYVVTFELSGLQKVEQKTTVELGRTVDVDATLQVAGVQESVTVTAETPSVLVTPSGGANYRKEEIDILPQGRTIAGIAALAPGLTTETTPNAGQLQISGSFAYDNVFLLDGVDINDNLFGVANDLFIEDAIEETQVLTSGISAEYGRFSGGVVNAITKSGGNLFSGSFRVNWTNPSWRTESPFEESRNITRPDTHNFVYEATFGGPIMKDKLWFFFAGRSAETSTSAPLLITGIPFTTPTDDKRGEIKLTGTVAQGHTLQGSYFKDKTSQTRVPFGFSIDPRVAENPEFPEDRIVANYKGAITSNLLGEFQVSRKKQGFRGTGGTSTDIHDSPFLTLTQELAHYNAPYFDANDPEDRDNRQFAGSLSYYLSTPRAGSHDIKGGVEVITTTQTGGNSQSSTGFVFLADYLANADETPIFDANGRIIPVFESGASLYQNWLPVIGANLDTTTTSLYFQDRWAATKNLSVDLGVRYERVRSEATGNIVGVDTDTWVPRLGATYDLTGNGEFTLQATYGHYSGKYSEAQFGRNTNVANPSALFAVYTGPDGQGLDFAPGFDPANYEIFNGLFPTANVFFDSGLSSPLTKEFTASFGAKLGRGYGKITYIRRSMSNFVEDFLDTSTGSTEVVFEGQSFGTFTNQVYRNSDIPQRDYQGMVLQGRYPITSRWSVNGHYTVQLEDDGNFEGEASNQPAVSSIFGDFPEVFNEARYYPLGRLDDYQRHRLRLWTIYAVPLGRAGVLDTSLLFRYGSALTYSLAANNVDLSDVQAALLEQAGYASGPTPQTLFFGERGSERFAGYGTFDLGLQYSIPVFRSLRPYVKLDLLNLLNNDKLIGWSTTVTPDPNSPLDSLGQPTGFIRGDNFGNATSNASFPVAREYRVAFGFRF